MGAVSFLAFVARQSLFPLRHPSKLAPAPPALHDLLALQLDHDHPQKQHLPAAHPLIHSFHSDLAARLHHLQLHGSGNAHLNWLLDALASTLSTHSSLLSTLITAAAGGPSTNVDHGSSAALAAAAAASLAKHRADEMLRMLDVCNSLKQVAHDIDRQLACLHRAAQSVGDTLASEMPLSSGRIRSAARKLSACLRKNGHPHVDILCTSMSSDKQYRPLAEARASLFLDAKTELHSPACASSDQAATLLNQAFDGAMLTSRLVLAAALSSLAPPSPRKSSGTIAGACKSIRKYLSAKRSASAEWASTLGQLHQDLRQEEEESTHGGALFQELQGLHSTAMNLHTVFASCAVLQGTELAAVKQRVESWRKSLEEAQACNRLLGIQMASFFQALVALRLALLDRISAY